jgi:nitroreductase
MIMEVMTAILTRRSVRRYTGVPIKEDELRTILEAGFHGPSAHNLRPMSFVVINDTKQLEAIAQFHPYAKMLPQAGCCIIVCGDIKMQKLEGFLVEDCSAAIENILLAAHSLNLGAVWCGLFPIKELTEGFTKLLNLPENIIPVGMVVIGNKEESVQPLNRYDETKIHYNNW